MVEPEIKMGSTLHVEFETSNYRHAEEILNSNLLIKRQIVEVLTAVEETSATKGADSLHNQIIAAFVKHGWQDEEPVAKDQSHEQRFDLFKERVAIEIEFSRYEFLYRDYMRFLSAYNSDKIDVGVLVTNTEQGLLRVKHKSIAPSVTRVKDDLAWLRPTVTVPIWIIGLK